MELVVELSFELSPLVGVLEVAQSISDLLGEELTGGVPSMVESQGQE